FWPQVVKTRGDYYLKEEKKHLEELNEIKRKLKQENLMQTKYKNILVLLGSVTLALFFIESGLRIAGELYLKKLYTHRVPAPGSTTVVCLGESSTAGLWVKKRESYPFQLRMMLQEYYPQKNIKVLVPPHVGQNTSQMANRIEDYIHLYDPVLLIIMAGYNNETSWGESHVIKFLKVDSPGIFKMKALIWLDHFRLFKLLRYAYIRFFYRKVPYYDSKMKNLRKVNYIWGGPELSVLSPEEQKRILDISLSHREAFIKLWRYDIETIVSAAKEHGVQVLLMTYKGFINDLLLHDDWHLNLKGYSLIAKNAFESIRDNKLLER
ncbi:MAG: hypothetical protein AMJ95_00005, partial [Omnitrophica WOR_2 bacterium SM23_72]